MSELSDLKISEIMTRNVTVASPTNKISQVMKFFAENMIHHLPVVDNGKLVGIISNKDVIKELYNNMYVGNCKDVASLENQITIDTIMTKDPVTTTSDATIIAVKELFGRVKFNCLPIMENGKLVGIVTPKDLMKMRIIKVDGADYGGY